jgi:hypothetical protein
LYADPCTLILENDGTAAQKSAATAPAQITLKGEKNQASLCMSQTESTDLSAELKRDLSFIRHQKQSPKEKSALQKKAKP